MWTRVNEGNLKDMGNFMLNIPDPEFIAYPTHQRKVVNKPIFPISRNPKKNNPLGVHMFDALCFKKYWKWYDKQQRGNYFYYFKKLTQAPL